MERGDHAGDDGEAGFGGCVESWHGLEQAEGVGVARMGKKFADGRTFDDAPSVHDDDVIAGFGNDAEVVGNEDHRAAVVLLDAFDEFEDLCLHGDVECGGRFIGNDEIGAQGEGEGDDHALAHAAGELVGVVARAEFGGGNADEFEHFDGGVPCVLAADFFVEEENFAELFADGVAGVERSHGLLEDDADVVATELAHFADGNGGEVFSMEVDLPLNDAACGLGQQAGDGHGGDAFAAARLADDA